MKNTFKKSKAFLQYVLFSAIVLCPQLVLAAGSPQAKVQGAIQGVTSFVMILVPSIGVLALAFFGLKALSTQESHKKAEQRGNMVDVCKYVMIIELAAPIIGWLVSLAN